METSDPVEPGLSTHARATRALKRARKQAGDDFSENPEHAKFLLEEARILAVLDLADAVRGDQAEASA